MKRYGISTWIVQDLPADEAIRMLAAAGFEETELSADACALVRAWEREPVGMRDKMASAGLGIRSVHSPGPGRLLDVEDEEARAASVATDVAYFNWMRESGVEEIVIHPTSSVDVHTEEAWAAARARAVESLQQLADSAGRAGIRMAVENLPRNGRPCSSMAELLGMIEGLGDHVGLCFDIGHAEMDHLDLVEELATAIGAGKLLSLHLHDVNADGKDHFIPGEGRIEWDVFLWQLDAAGFEGGRILEISPPEADVAGRVRDVAAVRAEWEGG